MPPHCVSLRNPQFVLSGLAFTINICSWSMFLLAEVASMRGEEPQRWVSSVGTGWHHNHPRQLFPCWWGDFLCWGSIDQVTEIYLDASQNAIEHWVGTDLKAIAAVLLLDMGLLPAGTLQVLESRMPESTISTHLYRVQHEPPMQGSFLHSSVWACQTALYDLPLMSSATSKKSLVTSSHNTYNELWWVHIQTYANERGWALKRSICKLKSSLNRIPVITENMPFSTQNK